MTTTTTTTDVTPTTSGFVDVGDAEIWYEQRGTGPDVLLLAGLSDTVESWELQLAGLSDRYRVTAYDNRGAGRSPMIPEGFTAADMADDAAGVIRGLGLGPVHVAGFSGGAMTGQELALRHPDVVRSLVLQSTWCAVDRYTRTVTDMLRWMPEVAPDERAMLEGFLVWIYTPRAHDEGMVAAIVEEALSFPHPQSPEAFVRQMDAWLTRATADRIHAISVPTLVLAGEQDIITRPALGEAVADRIPGARFVLQPGEAHQPFQERPDEWNALVDGFWQEVG